MRPDDHHPIKEHIQLWRPRNAKRSKGMSDQSLRLRYMLKSEIATEIAEMVGISDYDPGRVSQSTRHANFTKEERRQIYETVSGKSGEGLLRKELTPLIMEEIGSELDSVYKYEFTRSDLKKIHQYLSDNN